MTFYGRPENADFHALCRLACETNTAFDIRLDRRFRPERYRVKVRNVVTGYEKHGLCSTVDDAREMVRQIIRGER